MKILFMGTPEFARANLVALCESKHTVAAVVTGSDKESGRGRRVTKTACRVEAEKRGLPLFMPKSLKSNKLREELARFESDLAVVAAFRVLPRELYALPRLGSINVHASLLPKYRGAAPINRAIINGEKETGLTSFFLADSVDTGDIILQQETAIDNHDSFDSLHQKLVMMTGEFLLRTLEMIETGDREWVPQDDLKASPAPKIYPGDAIINFAKSAELVRNFVRGMSSKPGAYTFLRGKKLKILSCELAETEGQTKFKPGSILADRKRLLVGCADAPLELTRVIPEGKKEMTGLAFKNGFQPESTEIFGKV